MLLHPSAYTGQELQCLIASRTVSQWFQKEQQQSIWIIFFTHMMGNFRSLGQYGDAGAAAEGFAAPVCLLISMSASAATERLHMLIVVHAGQNALLLVS